MPVQSPLLHDSHSPARMAKPGSWLSTMTPAASPDLRVAVGGRSTATAEGVGSAVGDVPGAPVNVSGAPKSRTPVPARRTPTTPSRTTAPTTNAHAGALRLAGAGPTPSEGNRSAAATGCSTASSGGGSGREMSGRIAWIA